MNSPLPPHTAQQRLCAARRMRFLSCNSFACLPLARCRTARDHYRKGTADITNRICHAACRHLDCVDRGDTDDRDLRGRYLVLIADFTRNPQRAQEARLHISEPAFPATAQGGAA